MVDHTTPFPKDFKETIFGLIPQDWGIITAEEYCIRVADGTHTTPNPTETGKFLITSKNIKEGQVVLTSAYKISVEDFEEINKRSKVDQWDVLLSMIGTVGEISIISSSSPDFAIKNIGLFKCGEESKAKWLYYFLRGKMGQAKIKQRMAGTTQSYITLGDLRNFPIVVPGSYEEQRAIVAVLSSLDEKIELLRKQNKTLESIAKAIFREWFINFNFPKHNSKPYKSNGGKMVISELGEIPDGWSVDTLEKIVSSEQNAIVDGPFGTQMKIAEYQDSGIPVIEMDFLENSFITKPFRNFVSPKKFDEVKRSCAKGGDIVISKTGTLGLLGILPNELDKTVIVSRLAKISPSKTLRNRLYIYLLMTHLSARKYWDKISSGSTMPIFNLTHIKSIKIAVPNDNLYSRFEDVLEPLYEKILRNNSQIQTLSTLRDTLLPKLMKGETRVTRF